jgi:peptidoglycan/LPS O-acetylase OafA/YrhL
MQVQEVAAPGHLAGGADATPYRVGVLDSIRGVAALVVVIHHCLLTQPAFSNFFFSNWETAAGSTAEQVMFHTPARIVWAGAEAVTLFYVLSGLVLALPWVEGRPPRYGGYCIKRICRIYLPYCAAVAGAMVLNILFRPHANIPGLSLWVNEMTWTNPVTPYVAVDHLLMIGHRNTVDGVIHTLIWEMRVSLLFPLLVMPVVRWRGWGAAGVALVLAAVIGGLQLVYGENTPPLDLLQWRPDLGVLGKLALEVQWTAYYSCFFVLGCVIALYLGELRRRLRPMLGVALLVIGLLAIQAHWSQLHVPQELMVGIGAALVIISALPNGPIHAVLSHRWLRWVGRISYSLYLVHVPLLLASIILLHAFLPIPLILIAVAITSLPLGWAFHELIAEPCTQFGKRLAGGEWPMRRQRSSWEGAR